MPLPFRAGKLLIRAAKGDPFRKSNSRGRASQAGYRSWEPRLGGMSSTPNIALSFLAVKKSNFTYDIFRRRLADDEESVPGTRYLPQDCEEQK